MKKLYWIGYINLLVLYQILTLHLNHNFMKDFIIVFKSSQDSLFTLTLALVSFRNVQYYYDSSNVHQD